MAKGPAKKGRRKSRTANTALEAAVSQAHLAAIRQLATGFALQGNANALKAAVKDPHDIVYRAMGIPVTADRKKVDAFAVADTPFAKSPEALTDLINRQIDAAGIPSTKHVGLPAIVKCLDKTIGDVVAAVARAIT